MPNLETQNLRILVWRNITGRIVISNHNTNHTVSCKLKVTPHLSYSYGKLGRYSFKFKRGQDQRESTVCIVSDLLKTIQFTLIMPSTFAANCRVWACITLLFMAHITSGARYGKYNRFLIRHPSRILMTLVTSWNSFRKMKPNLTFLYFTTKTDANNVIFSCIKRLLKLDHELSLTYYL